MLNKVKNRPLFDEFASNLLKAPLGKQEQLSNIAKLNS
jgi:hypothetical protein